MRLLLFDDLHGPDQPEGCPGCPHACQKKWCPHARCAPAGLLLEVLISAVLISLGFPIFALVGGVAAFGFLAVLSVVAWTAAALTALTLVRGRPCRAFACCVALRALLPMPPPHAMYVYVAPWSARL